MDVPIGTYYGSAHARRDDTVTSRVQTFTATLNHRFSDALSLRNITRYSSYHLDRNNTLSSGTTDPVRLTVGRTRGFVDRDESGWFNQTDLTYRNQLGGFQQEWLVGTEFGLQRKRLYTVSSAVGYQRVNIFNPVADPLPIPAASYLADSAIPSNSEFKTAALYMQDQITLAPQWKALVGARYDVFTQDTTFERKLSALERTDRKFSPRAGLVWQPDSVQSYYVSYSRSFQPSGENFALSTSNIDNEPEITVNKEIGAKFDLLDGALNLTTALFNLERSGIKNTDPNNPRRQINVGTQRTNGLELALNGRLPGRWDVSAGYAYLGAEMVKSVATVSSLQLPVGRCDPGAEQDRGAHAAPLRLRLGHEGPGPRLQRRRWAELRGRALRLAEQSGDVAFVPHGRPRGQLQDRSLRDRAEPEERHQPQALCLGPRHRGQPDPAGAWARAAAHAAREVLGWRCARVSVG